MDLAQGFTFSQRKRALSAKSDVQRNRRLGGQETREQRPRAWLYKEVRPRAREPRFKKKGKTNVASFRPLILEQCSHGPQKLREVGQGVWRERGLEGHGGGGQKTPGSSCSRHPALPEGLTLTTGLRSMDVSGFQAAPLGEGASCICPHSPTQSPGKAGQTVAGTRNHPLLRILTSRRPGSRCDGQPPRRSTAGWLSSWPVPPGCPPCSPRG